MIFQIIGLVLMLIAPLTILGAVAGQSPMAVIEAMFSMIGILAIGGILIVVGAILFVIMLIKMNEIESDLKIAGILLIVGIILDFIAGGIGLILLMILIYTSSKRALKQVQVQPL